MKHSYLYETHLHTREVSACARCAAADYISFYKRRGYTGLFITDHFLRGNTCVSRELPWQEQVTGYCAGYEHARAEGEKQDLQIFLGMEAGFERDEMLLYGITPEWMLAHPEMPRWDHARLFREVDAIGGFVVQAHPFREAYYLKEIQLYPTCAHAAEVCNIANEPQWNGRAVAYAKHWNLPGTCGSDRHWIDPERDGKNPRLCAMAFEQPLQEPQDYGRLVRAGCYAMLASSPCITYAEGISDRLPVFLHNVDEALLPCDASTLFGTTRRVPEKLPCVERLPQQEG